MKIVDRDEYEIKECERLEIRILAGLISDPSANIDEAAFPSGHIQWGNEGRLESSSCDYYRFFKFFLCRGISRIFIRVIF